MVFSNFKISKPASQKRALIFNSNSRTFESWEMRPSKWFLLHTGNKMKGLIILDPIRINFGKQFAYTYRLWM